MPSKPLDEYDLFIERECIRLLQERPDNQFYNFHERFGSGSMHRWQLERGMELCITRYDSIEGKLLSKDFYFRDTLEVTLITSGYYKVIAFPSGEIYEGKEGELIFSRLQLNPNVLFEIWAQNCETVNIKIDLTLFESEQELLRFLRESLPEANLLHFYKKMLAPQKINWLFQRLLDYSSPELNSHPNDFFQRKGMAFQILSESLQWVQQQGQAITLTTEDCRLLHQAKEILVKRMAEPPSVMELSRLCCMNTTKLKKGFKQLFQTTISSFIVEEKIQRGKQLLEGTEMTVTEIAENLGYQNPSKFSSAFKKRYGLSPKEWRNRTK
ncbi:helix-turn-helix transcriptional regulator [Caldalkalibacillus mannanilyticus]|uniref:helix-turn-helix transcriptional regulator n=1 Tax=Caldalkalibacillus mannanilyticus TaxID=1418 RepID=UPI00046A566F|nr:AraC family transcriptional regulator [Caldalkalibacillus mannanilyticus]